MKFYKNRAISKYSFFFLGIVVLVFLWICFFKGINYICPFRLFFHLWCPGCGGTRMIKAIFRLDFYQAFRYNQLLFILLIAGIMYFMLMIVIYWKNKIIIFPSMKVFVFLLIVLIIYMILRNIPAFSYLIPTKV